MCIRDRLKIEVTTLTVEELAKLVNPEEQAYYGVDLDNVDLILSLIHI